MKFTEHIFRIELRTAVKKREAIKELLQAHEQSISSLVMMCRAEGITWSDIGEMLGTTKQAACERYKHDLTDAEMEWLAKLT